MDLPGSSSEQIQRFARLLLLLRHVFSNGTVVSEDNYHDIVHCMRDYQEGGRAAATEERQMMNTLGWPAHYHPCDYMENIRFCLVFGSHNPTITMLVTKYWEASY